MNQSVEKTHKLIRLNNPVRKGSLPQIANTNTSLDSTIKPKEPIQKLAQVPNVKATQNVSIAPAKHSPHYKFAIEFTAGALGGVVSRTV